MSVKSIAERILIVVGAIDVEAEKHGNLTDGAIAEVRSPKQVKAQ
jgi:hypothetical protein